MTARQYSITLSKLSRLVYISFSFIFLCIIYSFSVSVDLSPSSSYRYFSIIRVILVSIIKFLIFTILHHSWWCDIWELFYYLIQVIPISFCFVFIYITVYHIFIIIHHSWICDIWEFLCYLFQGIPISFCFIYVNIRLYYIFTRGRTGKKLTSTLVIRAFLSFELPGIFLKYGSCLFFKKIF